MLMHVYNFKKLRFIQCKNVLDVHQTRAHVSFEERVCGKEGGGGLDIHPGDVVIVFIMFYSTIMLGGDKIFNFHKIGGTCSIRRPEFPPLPVRKNDQFNIPVCNRM